MSSNNDVKVRGNLARNWYFVEEDGDAPARALNAIAIDNGTRKDGTRRPPHFVNVTCFGRVARRAARNTEKGQYVSIEGRLDTYRREYPNMLNPETGAPHTDYQVSIIADFIMEGAKSKKSQTVPTAEQATSTQEEANPEVKALLAAMSPEMQIAFAKALVPSIEKATAEAQVAQAAAEPSAEEKRLLQELAGKQGRERTSGADPF